MKWSTLSIEINVVRFKKFKKLKRIESIYLLKLTNSMGINNLVAVHKSLSYIFFIYIKCGCLL